MSEYGSREVTIVAPYDSTVSAVVQEESLPVWIANGWRVGVPDAKADVQADVPAPAPQDGAVQGDPVTELPPPAPVVKK